MIICGFGLALGVFAGEAPFTLTVVPAVVGVIMMLIAAGLAFVPTDLQRRLDGFARRTGAARARWRSGWPTRRRPPRPASATAIAHVRSGDPALLGAIAFWGFQIAVLWAAFHAFGSPPPKAVLVQGFFLGMLGNLLPLPGGVGGVEGGMIGAFAAFGVDTGLAVVAVLVFRALTFWLPMVPGVIAYFQLRKTVERWRAERVAM